MEIENIVEFLLFRGFVNFIKRVVVCFKEGILLVYWFLIFIVDREIYRVL